VLKLRFIDKINLWEQVMYHVRQDSLSGPAVIAYADTLIRADFELDPS
jgi:hypothetical protein